ncbi:hypothetical protein MLD52_18845 [Puniceicoccaceae bacterium K14]|nr:hypothetical protein [Puniceicoccaceae bacterium K14]
MKIIPKDDEERTAKDYIVVGRVGRAIFFTPAPGDPEGLHQGPWLSQRLVISSLWAEQGPTAHRWYNCFPESPEVILRQN